MADSVGGDISVKTWARAVDPINKVGYMDGAADGQSATFQSSFDKGYEQGFIFGFEIGCTEGKLSSSVTQGRSSLPNLLDPRRINCQICVNSTTAQENIANLYNVQTEKNNEYLQKFENDEINR